MKKDFISGLKTHEFKVAGKNVPFPLRVHDCFKTLALFPVTWDKAVSRLPIPSLQPAMLVPHTSTVGIAFTEYSALEGLEPFNEMEIFIPVTHDETTTIRGQVDGFVLYHIVDKMEALDVSREIYGYPSLLARIVFEDHGDTRHCLLKLGDQVLLSISMKAVPTALQDWNAFRYSIKDEQLVRAKIAYEGELGTALNRGNASIWLGEHEIPEMLRKLEMGYEAVSQQWIPSAKAIIDIPEKKWFLKEPLMVH